MVPRQDSKLQPVKLNSVTLPIAPLHHPTPHINLTAQKESKNTSDTRQFVKRSQEYLLLEIQLQCGISKNTQTVPFLSITMQQRACEYNFTTHQHTQAMYTNNFQRMADTNLTKM